MRARETIALQQLLEVEPARQVLRRSDDREQAALALLLQLEPVAHGHRHADRLDQGRFARIARWQRVDVGEAAPRTRRPARPGAASRQGRAQSARRCRRGSRASCASILTLNRPCQCVRITLGFAGEPARLLLVSILDSLRPVRGLRVLVTAGARGVGAAIARAFHVAGSRVHVCDVDRSALDRLRSEVPGITHSMADVSLSADVVTVFEDVQGTLGGLDVLIGNGGIAGPTGPVETIDGAGWERTIAVNLHSQFHFARRAVPMLKRSLEGGRVVMTAASPGETGDPFRAAAASSTWAVLGLMRSLAVELGPDGIRVNTILLGSGPRAHSRQGRQRDAARPELDDAAALALFLCSPAARNLTGQAVRVDGLVPPFSAPP